MEESLAWLVLLLMAFAAEIIDSSLGMGYGTILSPVLIVMGYHPLVVIPSILFSQALGGFSAAIFHHRLKNANFISNSRDTHIVIVITVLGVVATMGAAFLATAIPKSVLKSYIGILVLLMGLILLSRAEFCFSWKKMIGVAILSSFNKGMSGGGFGPVVTSGQIISGHNHKNAIGVTTASEVPICLVGFLMFSILKGCPPMGILIPLTVGSLLATPIGTRITRYFPEKGLRPLLGILVLILGIWTLIKTWL